MATSYGAVPQNKVLPVTKCFYNLLTERQKHRERTLKLFVICSFKNLLHLMFTEFLASNLSMPVEQSVHI